MGWRLAALSLLLRLTEKPRLRRMRDVGVLREGFERIARRSFHMPKGVPAEAGPVAGVPCVRYGAGGRATILYLHGGAFLAGGPVTHGHLAAGLSLRAGCAAVLLDYRLAPEHPFPAAVEDALAVYRALRADGPVVLAGDSAGGGLVFALLVALRAAGLADPLALVAFSPWADMRVEADSLSRNARADALLPADRIREVAQAYLGGADPDDTRASPVLSRFAPAPPPTVLAASRCEILADDAAAMAAALERDGGAVVAHWHATAPHAWPIFAGLVPEADATLDAAGRFLAGALRAARPLPAAGEG